ncbi:MAG TPA: M2 family metallopeptidase [Woeseiaceae bacterium]|nr:M2 family metallopeptidase [Woeseiaceae bacterium]
MQRLLPIAMLALALGACEIRINGDEDEHADETADEFVSRINTELEELSTELGAAAWVRATYITHDTAILSTLANEKYARWHSESVRQSLRYADDQLSPETARALLLLKLDTSEPAPADAQKRKELASITTELAGMYGAGRYCPPDGGACLGLPDLETVLADSRDYDELLAAWIGWRTVAPPMRDKYRRFVELANEGAAELGYADLGEMWRAGYDMPPAGFRDETLRLWNQVKPLYDELHCHVRATLAQTYGEDKVPLDAPIPAHLLGNMWSQSWGEVFDLLEPYPGAGDLDVDSALAAQDYTPQAMVRSAEQFYVSLGLPALPETFWERSLFSKPADRDVVCHASAWGLDGGRDLRIKMCIKQNYEDLRTIYHELGHNFYQRAYSAQPPLFRGGAHGGFHEAIGDTITLSMTPAYLARVRLVDTAAQSQEATINRQMQQALDKIAFLPFGKLIDEWRWDVFAGNIAPQDYNKAWWALRTKYQGIAPPVARSEEDFDAGAKYHVPANVSYTRYFLAHILQFQFQRALCDAAGFDGPLHECSIYGSEEAGRRLAAMLEAGASRPWQDTLQALTGTRQMDASAITDYFAPLMSWLEKQNEGRSCGW